MHKKALVLHRRDLRTDDNTALNKALQESQSVIPCFIYDTRQTGASNAYRSNRAVRFMTSSVDDLSEQYQKHGGHLYLFEGIPHDVLEKIITQEHIDAVYVNQDYTPFSQARDAELKKVCDAHKIAFVACHDLMLIGDPDQPGAKNGSGDAYKVFTAFFKQVARTIPVPKPQHLVSDNFYTQPIDGDAQHLITHFCWGDKGLVIPAGSGGAKRLLQEAGQLAKYSDTRDIPAHKTSHLSAHNKFGTISIRRVFHELKQELGAGNELLRQLYWRDFFTQLAYHNPRVYQGAFNEKFDTVRWENDMEKFDLWCRGETGFPIVDAGMRELNETGYMHNRARMIVASFLTKDLHIDWRLGEKYFASQLLDYDPAVNNGSWQWVAGTGADAAPYFRIFNPWLQQKKFDPDAVYIKRWVDELKDVEPDAIHAIETKGVPESVHYPGPIVNHSEEAKKVKEYYLQV